MSSLPRFQPPVAPDDVPTLHGRAMDNLRFIRETMEQAKSFTAVSGWALVAVGASAIFAAAVAARLRSTGGADVWLVVWAAEAVLALVLLGVAMRRKARRANSALLAAPGRKMVSSFAPPMFVGAILTVAFASRGLFDLLPGAWLLLYGTGVVTGGAYSVPSVPVMGICFMLAGALTLLLCPPALADYVMATTFGGLHLVFGFYIARRHGG